MSDEPSGLIAQLALMLVALIGWTAVARAVIKLFTGWTP